MKNAHQHIKSIVVTTLLLSVMIGSFLVIMAQEPLRQRDALAPQRHALAPLKRALNETGAPALTPQQETQLTSIITTFRNERQSPRPNETLEAARRAYEEAILAGQSEAAKSQVNIIAEQMTAHAKEHLLAEVDLKIQILSVLTERQKSSLLQAVGDAGLIRLLSAGGPPHHRRGRPGGPDGPGGFPPPRPDDH
jgi:Spy/CpxP family protein refolding chaperone